jgi:hypothetical protein
LDSTGKWVAGEHRSPRKCRPRDLLESDTDEGIKSAELLCDALAIIRHTQELSIQISILTHPLKDVCTFLAARKKLNGKNSAILVWNRALLKPTIVP